MEEKERLNFTLGIVGVDTPAGIKFYVATKNEGVPDKNVIMLVRNWLRVTETLYHEQFKQDHKSSV
jgi:hypothetical protein